MIKKTSRKNRVVVTGVGSFSPTGIDFRSLCENVSLGKCMAMELPGFSPEDWETVVGCRLGKMHVDAARGRYGPLSRISLFGLTSADEAIADSGISSFIDDLIVSVHYGTGLGGTQIGELTQYFRGADVSKSYSKLWEYLQQHSSPSLYECQHPSILGYQVASRFGARRDVEVFQSACAASAQAIGSGFRRIQSGDVDAAIVGGSDSISSEFIFAGFCLLGVMTKKNSTPCSASRPFCKTRDGFLASEGATTIVLESLESAERRGAKVYCEVLGYGESQNAYRITDLREDGKGTMLAMLAAISDAGISV